MTYSKTLLALGQVVIKICIYVHSSDAAKCIANGIWLLSTFKALL